MKCTGVYLRIILSLTAFTFFLHVVPGFVSAQTTNGMIQGTVHDVSGAAVAGVRVSLKSMETGASRSVSTDSDGAYEFLSLPAGAYAAEASLQGFKTQLRE